MSLSRLCACRGRGRGHTKLNPPPTPALIILNIWCWLHPCIEFICAPRPPAPPQSHTCPDSDRATATGHQALRAYSDVLNSLLVLELVMTAGTHPVLRFTFIFLWGESAKLCRGHIHDGVFAVTNKISCSRLFHLRSGRVVGVSMTNLIGSMNSMGQMGQMNSMNPNMSVQPHERHESQELHQPDEHEHAPVCEAS
jgi:hypothetical protein